MTKRYLHILFPEKISPGDIDIITQPDANQPGQAQLNQAHVGQPRPEAPNSLPLDSHSGGRIGFVANAEYLEAPYDNSYLIQRRGDQ